MKTIEEALQAFNPSPKKTGPKQQYVGRQSQGALALKDDAQAKQRLSTMLYTHFNALKTYGKDPESLESIIAVHAQSLEDYPYDQIEAAFKIHAKRSDEFSTPSDIVGIIKRRGKPPLSKEMYIAISKKDGEFRTPDDWQYLRDYEDEMKESDSIFTDTERKAYSHQENIRLRLENAELRAEISRLNDIIIGSRSIAPELKPIPKPPIQITVKKTIDAMRSMGSSEEDIKAFAESYNMAGAA